VGVEEKRVAHQAARARSSRLRVRTVRGEPYHVGDVTLIPEARIVSFGRGRATIGTSRVSGSGMAFSHVTLAAVVVAAPEGETRIPIVDATASVIRRLVAVAAGIVLLSSGVRSLVRRR
jgi:uncharacterized spore protein YtfJ